MYQQRQRLGRRSIRQWYVQQPQLRHDTTAAVSAIIKTDWILGYMYTDQNRDEYSLISSSCRDARVDGHTTTVKFNMGALLLPDRIHALPRFGPTRGGRRFCKSAKGEQGSTSIIGLRGDASGTSILEKY